MTEVASEPVPVKAECQVRPAVCDSHGEFESRCLAVSPSRVAAGVWSRCPKCADERRAMASASAEVAERLERREKWQQLLGRAGIPERFRDRRLSTYIAATAGQKRALEFAKQYAASFDSALRTGRSALFTGKPGTGKTHLAVGIGLEVMERDQRSVLFTTVLRAIRRVKDTWSRESIESESRAISTLTIPDLLILDELGVQFGSDTEKLILFDILNERYELRKPTLFLTNLASAEAAAVLGERIVDRLREDGGDFVVFDWASHRGRTEELAVGGRA